MTTKTRVDPLRDYDSFQESLRNFHDWLGPVVSGAADIDFICERNHQFLIIEAKPYFHGIEVAYGQHLMLYRLARQPNTTLLLVGEDKNAVYVVDYATPIPPEIVRRKGKPVAIWKPDRCEEMTKERLRARVEAWWEDANG